MKKAKPTAPSVPITNDVQKGDPTSKSRSRNSREGVSLFKQLSLSMSRKPSNKSTRENSTLYPAPPGAFPGKMSLEASHSSFTNEMTAFPISPASQFVLDIARLDPVLNVEPFTSGSSDEERSFEQHVRNVTSRRIIPSDSTQTTNTEATAINEVPSAFPKFDTYPFKEPIPPVSLQFQRPIRSRSLVERARPLGLHFERTRPSTRADSTVFGATERLNHASINNDPYTRGRRVTTGILSGSKPTPPSPPEGKMGSNSRNQAHAQYRDETQTLEQRAPMEDAYTNLFTSCAISIFLLIILAAGKQVLYLFALLPVLSALVKHVPELDSLRTGIPLVKKNIKALLTL